MGTADGCVVTVRDEKLNTTIIMICIARPRVTICDANKTTCYVANNQQVIAVKDLAEIKNDVNYF